jgi:hypothetical protein
MGKGARFNNHKSADGVDTGHDRNQDEDSSGGGSLSHFISPVSSGWDVFATQKSEDNDVNDAPLKSNSMTIPTQKYRLFKTSQRQSNDHNGIDQRNSIAASLSIPDNDEDAPERTLSVVSTTEVEEIVVAPIPNHHQNWKASRERNGPTLSNWMHHHDQTSTQQHEAHEPSHMNATRSQLSGGQPQPLGPSAAMLAEKLQTYKMKKTQSEKSWSQSAGRKQGDMGGGFPDKKRPSSFGFNMGQDGQFRQVGGVWKASKSIKLPFNGARSGIAPFATDDELPISGSTEFATPYRPKENIDTFFSIDAKRNADFMKTSEQNHSGVTKQGTTMTIQPLERKFPQLSFLNEFLDERKEREYERWFWKRNRKSWFKGVWFSFLLALCYYVQFFVVYPIEAQLWRARFLVNPNGV